jgi:flagellar FliJ protein
MQNSNAIETVCELAENDCREGMEKLAHALYRAKEADTKLQTLETFRADYDQRRREAASTDARRLSIMHAFLSNLDTAIEEQKRSSAAAAAGVASARQELEAARKRRRSLEVLLERRAAEARRAEGRAEQKLQDEWAARMTAAVASIG